MYINIAITEKNAKPMWASTWHDQPITVLRPQQMLISYAVHNSLKSNLKLKLSNAVFLKCPVANTTRFVQQLTAAVQRQNTG